MKVVSITCAFAEIGFGLDYSYKLYIENPFNVKTDVIEFSQNFINKVKKNK